MIFYIVTVCCAEYTNVLFMLLVVITPFCVFIAYLDPDNVLHDFYHMYKVIS